MSKTRFEIQRAEIIVENNHPQYMLFLTDDPQRRSGVITDPEVIKNVDQWFEESGNPKAICCYGDFEKNTVLIQGPAPREEWWLDE